MRNKSHFEKFIFKCPGVIRLVTLGLKEKFMEDTIKGKEIKAREHKIFLDLKIHDILNTVKKAMAVLSNLDVDITNLNWFEKVKR